ncbi:bidirectional sugar transporter SWEET3-like isoform X2 [Nymphaea colorata]|uniref:bidirectional sugar transporter SWEET3-like isoform X2 n=1 Tax=Nymphaea colorata TaxID=210225 RepID=UPI00214EEF64|nr:bidirectional sugar transporter SWEET3-like isoform X2 [Nymphaea colorata]
MGSIPRLALGIMGNATSLLLYAAPILTFRRVIQKRSTEDFSCTPYIVALLNCALYTWYGLPVVSYKWENLLLVTTNGTGMLMEASFVLIYLYFTSAKGKWHVWSIMIPTVIIFLATALISWCLFSEHHQRKVVVGSVALATSIAMYGSPLVVVLVIKTKSVEFMPFYLSLFSFLSSSLWLAYGLVGRDLFVALLMDTKRTCQAVQEAEAEKQASKKVYEAGSEIFHCNDFSVKEAYDCKFYNKNCK